MPKEFDLSVDPGDSCGMKVTWTPSAQRLDFHGWFDHYCGIDGRSMSLAGFLEAVGVTPRDLRRALAILADAEYSKAGE